MGRYQYFGVLTAGRTRDRPVGVFRVWGREDGVQVEEVFTRDLVWEPSGWTSVWVRPGYYDQDYVAIDEAVAHRFVEEVRDQQGSSESLEVLLEARPAIPVRERKVTVGEALELIRAAQRPADAGWRDYLSDPEDPLFIAHKEADDDSQRVLRDAAEQLLLGDGDDCPVAVVDVLGWSPWGFRERDRLSRLIDHYISHGPVQQLGRSLWKQSSWIKPDQVQALEAAIADDPMQHLWVVSVVLKHSYFATGALWDSIAVILGSSTDPDVLARLYDHIEMSGTHAAYYDVVRPRKLPRALLEAIAARTSNGSRLFLAAF